MSAARRWVLASGNAGKLAELRTLLNGAELDFEVIAQSDLGVSAARRTGATLLENALAKRATPPARPACLPSRMAPGSWSPRLAVRPGVLGALRRRERGGQGQCRSFSQR